MTPNLVPSSSAKHSFRTSAEVLESLRNGNEKSSVEPIVTKLGELLVLRDCTVPDHGFTEDLERLEGLAKRNVRIQPRVKVLRLFSKMGDTPITADLLIKLSSKCRNCAGTASNKKCHVQSASGALDVLMGLHGYWNKICDYCERNGVTNCGWDGPPSRAKRKLDDSSGAQSPQGPISQSDPPRKRPRMAKLEPTSKLASGRHNAFSEDGGPITADGDTSERVVTLPPQTLIDAAYFSSPFSLAAPATSKPGHPLGGTAVVDKMDPDAILRELQVTSCHDALNAFASSQALWTQLQAQLKPFPTLAVDIRPGADFQLCCTRCGSRGVASVIVTPSAELLSSHYMECPHDPLVWSKNGLLLGNTGGTTGSDGSSEEQSRLEGDSTPSLPFEPAMSVTFEGSVPPQAGPSGLAHLFDAPAPLFPAVPVIDDASASNFWESL